MNLLFWLWDELWRQVHGMMFENFEGNMSCICCASWNSILCCEGKRTIICFADSLHYQSKLLITHSSLFRSKLTEWKSWFWEETGSIIFLCLDWRSSTRTSWSSLITTSTASPPAPSPSRLPRWWRWSTTSSVSTLSRWWRAVRGPGSISAATGAI